MGGHIRSMLAHPHPRDGTLEEMGTYRGTFYTLYQCQIGRFHVASQMSIKVGATWIANFDISMRGFDRFFFQFRYFDPSLSLKIRPKVLTRFVSPVFATVRVTVHTLYMTPKNYKLSGIRKP